MWMGFPFVELKFPPIYFVAFYEIFMSFILLVSSYWIEDQNPILTIGLYTSEMIGDYVGSFEMPLDMVLYSYKSATIFDSIGAKRL